MVHVLYAHYKIRKSYFMMGSVCLDIGKDVCGCYTCTRVLTSGKAICGW